MIGLVKEVNKMADTYTVYDDRTNEIVARGTYAEIEDYAENPGRYSVVSNLNGICVNKD